MTIHDLDVARFLPRTEVGEVSRLMQQVAVGLGRLPGGRRLGHHGPDLRFEPGAPWAPSSTRASPGTATTSTPRCSATRRPQGGLRAPHPAHALRPGGARRRLRPYSGPVAEALPGGARAFVAAVLEGGGRSLRTGRTEVGALRWPLRLVRSAPPRSAVPVAVARERRSGQPRRDSQGVPLRHPLHTSSTGTEAGLRPLLRCHDQSGRSSMVS